MDLTQNDLAHYDTYFKQELPLLSELVSKIHRVHGASHEELEQVKQIYHDLKTKLEHHLANEDGTSDSNVFNQSLDDMRKASHDYALPEDACRTYGLTYKKLEKLEEELKRYMRLVHRS